MRAKKCAHHADNHCGAYKSGQPCCRCGQKESRKNRRKGGQK